MNDGCLCVFGEVLFDHFPDGKRVLGGAPFNVAWHLQAFGRSPCFISRVGEDAEGAAVRQAMSQWGMRTDALQTDGQLPTGRVAVQFHDGEPHYDIVAPAAYDAIAAMPALHCDLLYHGSLALRDAGTRQALSQLKASGCSRVFLDVNLRAPWWTAETLDESLRGADWVKLNEVELALLSPSPAGEADQAAAFLSAYELSGLVVTRGAQGAVALTAAGERHEAPPPQAARVVDTVGAGDAFAAVTILGLASDWPLERMLSRAQAFASAMVGQRGATVNDTAFYRPFIDEWQLEV